MINKNNSKKCLSKNIRYSFTLEYMYETDSGKSAVVKSVSDIIYATDIVDAYAKCMNITEQLNTMDPDAKYEIASIERDEEVL